MDVGRGQQFAPSCLDPAFASARLTLWQWRLPYGEFFLMGSSVRVFAQGGLFGLGWAGGDSP
jgi:hypothetical protein